MHRLKLLNAIRDTASKALSGTPKAGKRMESQACSADLLPSEIELSPQGKTAPAGALFGSADKSYCCT